MRNHLSNSSRRKCWGGALIEFAVILPLILLLITAILNIGRFLWQIQMVSDAALYGARKASALSDTNSSATCEDLITEAQSAAMNYLASDTGLKIKVLSVWSGAVATILPSYTYKTIPIRMIEVRFMAKDNADNCLFCYQSFLRKIVPSAIAVLDLAMTSNCTVTPPPPAASTCLQPPSPTPPVTCLTDSTGT